MFIKVSDKLIKDAAVNNLSLFIYTLIKGDKSPMRNVYQTTINSLVEACGFKPDQHSGKINDKTVDTLRRLELDKIIQCQCDITKAKPSQLFKILFNEKNRYERDMKHFAIIEDKQFEKINELQTNNKAEIMRVFLYIKLFMFEQIEGCPISKITLNQLKNIINVSSTTTVADLINVLIENKILYRYTWLDTSNDNFKTIAFYSVIPFTERMQKICEGL